MCDDEARMNTEEQPADPEAGDEADEEDEE
jgi:hypothetical protein